MIISQDIAKNYQHFPKLLAGLKTCFQKSFSIVSSVLISHVSMTVNEIHWQTNPSCKSQFLSFFSIRKGCYPKESYIKQFSSVQFYFAIHAVTPVHTKRFS